VANELASPIRARPSLNDKRRAVRAIFESAHAVLSPMAGVTDRMFRALCARHGADVTYCEFVSANGVLHGNPASFDLMELGENEHPVGIQLFGSDPGILAEAARTAEKVGPDIIDLNFGCPVKKVVKRNGGSALLCNVPLMQEIVEAVVLAVSLPVTAKIRTGWSRDQLNYLEVTKMLEEVGVCAITVHGRTRDQLFTGSADWEPIAQMVEIASVPIIGNGDVVCGDDYFRMKRETGCEAVMIARGAIGNPFVFEEIRAREEGTSWSPPTVAQIIDLMIEHLDQEIALKGAHTGMMRMRKHFSHYLKGHAGASGLRKRVYLETERDRVVDLLLEYRAFNGEERVA
jgi:nifR3 family TIM-barrel protein